MPPDALRHHLALALVSGLGPKRTAALIARFGDPAAVLRATAAELRTVPLIGDKLADQFASQFRSVDVDAELDRMSRHGVRAILPDAADYPQRLTAITDAPPLLFVRGSLTESDANAVAIVGSRQCTAYGLRTAERLAGGLARAGWTVVSGLARGIDAAAHRGALAAGGRTVAVLAGGLGSIYPPEHTDLAEQMVASGCLFTETPMSVPPQAGMFPARNRIVSGMSRAVVVVEANERSGALITVDHAAEQGREVFAVPGPVDSPASAGCLKLLRDGAKLVRSADDILDDLRGIAPPDPPPKKAPPAEPTLFRDPPPAAVNLDPIQQAVWDALAEPRHADELARALSLPAQELTRTLTLMDMKKLVRRLPGNRYERR